MQRRLLAIFAPVIAVVALLAGCTGTSSDLPSEFPDPDTLLRQSSQTTAGQTSVHLQLSVKGQVAGLPIESLEGDLTQIPAVAAKGTVDMTLFGQSLKDVEFVIVDGDLWAVITAGAAPSNFGAASAIYDVAAILDPDVGLANVLAGFSGAKAAARETIGGVGTVRITGTVSEAAVNKIVPQIGVKGPVPGTVWIAEGSDHELMQARLEPSTDSSITMTLSKWGEPVTVDTPAV